MNLMNLMMRKPHKMDRETLKKQYLTYIECHMITAFNLASFHEHITGNSMDHIDNDELAMLVDEIVNETVPVLQRTVTSTY